MGLFDFFSNFEKEEVSKYGKLYEKIASKYANIPETELVMNSCIAGLMARVAYVDFELHDNELKKMIELMDEWNAGSFIDDELIVNIAIEHIKEMAGLENHLYVHPLKDILNKDQRYQVLRCLFLIAASDGEVEAVESEEIRTICKGLELSNQHFLSARAEVSEFIKALK